MEAPARAVKPLPEDPLLEVVTWDPETMVYMLFFFLTLSFRLWSRVRKCDQTTRTYRTYSTAETAICSR